MNGLVSMMLRAIMSKPMVWTIIATADFIMAKVILDVLDLFFFTVFSFVGPLPTGFGLVVFFGVCLENLARAFMVLQPMNK